MSAIPALQIWAALPVPALLLDAHEHIVNLNPAAEVLFNSSTKAMTGTLLWDRLTLDAHIKERFARVRMYGTPLFANDVDMRIGTRASLVCNLQVAPISENLGEMIMLISPRELAGRMVQNSFAKAAAKSAIGMATITPFREVDS